jgi:hypothetical protein
VNGSPQGEGNNKDSIGKAELLDDNRISSSSNSIGSGLYVSNSSSCWVVEEFKVIEECSPCTSKFGL